MDISIAGSPFSLQMHEDFFEPNSAAWKGWRSVGCPDQARWARESTTRLSILSAVPATAAAQESIMQAAAMCEIVCIWSNRGIILLATQSDPLDIESRAMT